MRCVALLRSPACCSGVGRSSGAVTGSGAAVCEPELCKLGRRALCARAVRLRCACARTRRVVARRSRRRCCRHGRCASWGAGGGGGDRVVALGAPARVAAAAGAALGAPPAVQDHAVLIGPGHDVAVELHLYGVGRWHKRLVRHLYNRVLFRVCTHECSVAGVSQCACLQHRKALELQHEMLAAAEITTTTNTNYMSSLHAAVRYTLD